MGGVGTGATFRRNIEALRRYKITTRLVHDITDPDTSMEFLGRKLSIPVMSAPITGAVTNMGGATDELEYNRSVIKGAINAGTISFVGDGATPTKYRVVLQALAESGGLGIPIFKPRSDNAEIIERIRAAEEAGALAVGVDIDAVVFKTMELKNQSVGPKGMDSLRELISSTKLPFILKGIMNPNDAIQAAEAGARGIIVSNHGGRVLDEMIGTMDVLEEISAAVRGRLFIGIDGGFRSGVDILKAIAYGAEAVLIGRPVAIAAVGMGAEGTAFYYNNLKKDLKKAMILTGCASISDISRDFVKIIQDIPVSDFTYRLN
jgi:isopentenyl diphosphate isomerase/L-lactate dehydrogenase-like FMN-dependent dehydrogenase